MTEIIASDPDCRWCSHVDGTPSDCTCRPEGCGHPNCCPLVSRSVEDVPAPDVPRWAGTIDIRAEEW